MRAQYPQAPGLGQLSATEGSNSERQLSGMRTGLAVPARSGRSGRTGDRACAASAVSRAGDARVGYGPLTGCSLCRRLGRKLPLLRLRYRPNVSENALMDSERASRLRQRDSAGRDIKQFLEGEDAAAIQGQHA